MNAIFRWFGTAALELRLDGYVLWIDPFFTRPPAWKVLLGRGRQPDPDAAARHVTRCDQILITHPHYDHLMDVPEVMRLTGAPAAGSANAAALLRLLGQPPERTAVLAAGSRLALGPWQLTVLPAWHTATPLDGRINAPLPQALRAPPHLLDYRMDACFGFLLEGGGLRLLVGNSPAPGPLDALFLAPYLPAGRLRAALRAQPRRLVAIHWDDFTRPLANPPPVFPLAALRLPAFRRQARRAAPTCELLFPEPGQEYEL